MCSYWTLLEYAIDRQGCAFAEKGCKIHKLSLNCNVLQNQSIALIIVYTKYMYLITYGRLR